MNHVVESTPNASPDKPSTVLRSAMTSGAMTSSAMTSAARRTLRVVTVLVLALVCLPSIAAAKGRVVWKSTTVTENEERESWKLDLEVHMNKAPDVAYVPMRFEFKPTAHYERALVDGREDPVETTIPLQNQQSLIESVDVGFLDAGTGVIQSRTKFSFKITRAHDYQAGEYQVTIKDTRDDSTVGTSTRLILKGKNPVVDRRSIVFTGGEKKKKKKEEPKPEASAAAEEPAPEPEATAEEPTEDAGAEPPPAVEERPGGGCHHGPPHGLEHAWLLVTLLLGVAYVARRRSN